MRPRLESAHNWMEDRLWWWSNSEWTAVAIYSPLLLVFPMLVVEFVLECWPRKMETKYGNR